jgi:hypothetical protein
MSNVDDLTWLMDWYLSQCDEDWEDHYGVKIDTMDNPGWSLIVDLNDTSLEGKTFIPVYENVTDENPIQGLWGDVSWLACKVDDTKFKGYGGPRDLGRIIGIFRQWVVGCTRALPL